MSKYTTELRYLCETKAGYNNLQSYSQINDVINKSWDKIFTSNFPIFDESYRPILCKKILKHFYTQEICAEVVGLWVLWLNTKMEEIMPFYNQLYKSTLLEFNPLYDVDIKRTHTTDFTSSSSGTTNSERNTTSNSDSSNTNDSTTSQNTSTSNETTDTSYNVFSDTPQGGLTGVETGNYLTDARKITDNISFTSKVETNETAKNSGGSKSNYSEDENFNLTNTGKNNSLESYTESVIGKQGSADYSSLLLNFRKTFLNIDMMIISELENLFMCVW